MSKDLQNEFKRISDAINDLSIRKAKAEANLDTLKAQRDEELEKIKKLAQANSLEEVKKKLEALEKKVEDLKSEAEGILNDKQ